MPYIYYQKMEKLVKIPGPEGQAFGSLTQRGINRKLRWRVGQTLICAIYRGTSIRVIARVGSPRQCGDESFGPFDDFVIRRRLALNV
jgi:hypothetical protein